MSTPAERAFWRRVNLRAARLEPQLSKEMLRGFEQLRRILDTPQMAQLIDTASLDRFVATALSDQHLDRAFVGLKLQLQEGLGVAVSQMAKELPMIGVPGIGFDVLNPNIIEGIRTLNSRVMTTLQTGVRAGVRRHVELGLARGVNPREIARDLRGIVGMAPSQVDIVHNFRRALEGGPNRAVFSRALDYKLRDHRFDGEVARALIGNTALSPQQVDKMVAAYARRMVAFNAETNARTAALDAMKLGHRLSWEDAIDNGAADPERLFKRWSNVGDDRVRPDHVQLHGEVRPFDEPFSNGAMIPGDNEFNCRCLAIYFHAPATTATATEMTPAQRKAAAQKAAASRAAKKQSAAQGPPAQQGSGPAPVMPAGLSPAQKAAWTRKHGKAAAGTAPPVTPPPPAPPPIVPPAGMTTAPLTPGQKAALTKKLKKQAAAGGGTVPPPSTPPPVATKPVFSAPISTPPPPKPPPGLTPAQKAAWTRQQKKAAATPPVEPRPVIPKGVRSKWTTDAYYDALAESVAVRSPDANAFGQNILKETFIRGSNPHGDFGEAFLKLLDTNIAGAAGDYSSHTNTVRLGWDRRRQLEKLYAWIEARRKAGIAPRRLLHDVPDDMIPGLKTLVHEGLHTVAGLNHTPWFYAKAMHRELEEGITEFLTTKIMQKATRKWAPQHTIYGHKDIKAFTFTGSYVAEVSAIEHLAAIVGDDALFTVYYMESSRRWMAVADLILQKFPELKANFGGWAFEKAANLTDVQRGFLQPLVEALAGTRTRDSALALANDWVNKMRMMP
jgi:hypothetical protein